MAQLVKNLPTVQEIQVQVLVWEDPLRRKWQPTPVFLPGKPHGQRSLAGYSPQGCTELDTTEQLNHLWDTSHMLLLFSCPVMSDSLWPHGLQHTRPPCPSLPPGVWPSSRSLYQWCHPATHLPSALNLFQHQGLFQWVVCCHQMTKLLELLYESFQWTFRIDLPKTDWFDLALQGTFSSLLQHHS